MEILKITLTFAGRLSESPSPFQAHVSVLKHPSTITILDQLGNGSNDRKPGIISESKIRKCAYQIASGLEHLQNIDVRATLLWI